MISIPEMRKALAGYNMSDEDLSRMRDALYRMALIDLKIMTSGKSLDIEKKTPYLKLYASQ